MTRMREIFCGGHGRETVGREIEILAHLLLDYQSSMLIIMELWTFIGMLLF